MKKNPCIEHNCSECCSPIKLKKGYKQYIGKDFDELPFKDRDELLIPENNIETVKLESYDCNLLDRDTGLCSDYENRPSLCKNTECAAYSTDDPNKQGAIINDIKSEKYIVCKNKRR